MMPGDHHHSQQLPLQTLLEFSFACPIFLSTRGKISAGLLYLKMLELDDFVANDPIMKKLN